MATEFKFPDVGEGIAEGEIVKWLVKEGDTVKADENIVQVETDKAVVDLPAPVGGKVLKINFKEGDTVEVGQVLVVIGGEGEKPPARKQEPKAKQKTQPEAGQKTEARPQAQTMQPSAAPGKVLAVPAVRKLARAKGIDLSTIKGSGKGGRILKKDLQGTKELKPEVPQQKVPVTKKYDESGYIEHMPLKGIRKTIARNMMKSLGNSAQVTAMEDMDVTELWLFREKEKERWKKQGVKLTLLSFIIKATATALQKNPILNSTLEGEDIKIKKYFNIGVAVETEVGLMVPNIKKVDEKGVLQIAKDIVTLAEKARTRQIDVTDLKGGTFTITNYGSVGGNYGTPVINPPEAGILGLGRVFDRVVSDENGNLSVAKILPVSLTFDHQILDGAQAARFLETLKGVLEKPPET